MRNRRTPRRKYYKRRRFSRFFLLFLLVLSIVYIFHHFIRADSVLSAREEETPLGKTVQNALAGAQGTYGIIIENLKTHESYSMNEHMVFDSASLYKLWVMGTTYSQIQSGKLSEADMLSEDVDTLNDELGLNSNNAFLTKGKISLGVKSALYQMVTISDNYDAELLTDRVGLTNIASFLHANGFNESAVGVNGSLPTTTASDIAQFFEKLYSGKLANQIYTKEMLNFLQQQQLNTKIPINLPSEVTIAHKTGELNAYSHDAGIVYTPKGNYIIKK